MAVAASIARRATFGFFHGRSADAPAGGAFFNLTTWAASILGRGVAVVALVARLDDAIAAVGAGGGCGGALSCRELGKGHDVYVAAAEEVDPTGPCVPAAHTEPEQVEGVVAPTTAEYLPA